MKKFTTAVFILMASVAFGQPYGTTYPIGVLGKDTVFKRDTVIKKIPVMVIDGTDTIKNVPFTYVGANKGVFFCEKGDVIIKGKGYYNDQKKWQWYGGQKFDYATDGKTIYRMIIQVFK